jgi:hypothetical protein
MWIHLRAGTVTIKRREPCRTLQITWLCMGQVFRAEGCNLRTWNASGFGDCFAGRRLILVGDSLMRQNFASLGCLLAPVSERGDSGIWGPKTSKVNGNHYPFLPSFCHEITQVMEVVTLSVESGSAERNSSERNRHCIYSVGGATLLSGCWVCRVSEANGVQWATTHVSPSMVQVQVQTTCLCEYMSAFVFTYMEVCARGGGGVGLF